MTMKFDSSIAIYLCVMAGLLLMVGIMKSRDNLIIWGIVQIVLGALLVFAFNLAGSKIHIAIPLNPISILFAGIFQLPGILLLVIIKYIIYS